MNARRGVGGAAQRVATASDGSSPSVSIKTRSKKVLRRMLADRDRALSRKFCITLDAERRFIRNRLKYLDRQ